MPANDFVLSKRRHSQTSSVRRFPRLRNRDRKILRAQLEKLAFKMIVDFRKLRVDLGRLFLRIKETLDHGEWEGYYAKTFASGLSLRTAQRCMLRATKADAATTNDNLTFFKAGTSPQAQEVQVTTAEAQAEIGTAPQPPPVHQLPLHLRAEESAGVNKLWRSSHRRFAERQVIAVLHRLLVKFGFLKT